MRVVDKDFPLICIIFSYYLGAMIFMKILMSYENHLSTCRGWDFNQKIGTESIFVIGPCYTIYSRGHATLELAVSVGRSVGPSRNFSVFRSCPPVRDWGGVYTALFYINIIF